jgi:hypothetical protein
MPEEVKTQHLIDALDRIEYLATSAGEAQEKLDAIEAYCTRLKKIADYFVDLDNCKTDYNDQRKIWQGEVKSDAVQGIDEKMKLKPGLLDNGC